MPSLKVRNVSILAKLESTYGVDPVPASTDGLYAIATAPTLLQEQNELPDVVGRGSLSKISASEPGPRHWRVDFRIPIRGAGAAYSTTTKPRIAALLRACGFQETLVTTAGSESVTYKPRSSGIESVTLYYNWDGLLYKLIGARGNVNFVARSGGIQFAEFSFEALYAQPIDQAITAVSGEPTNLQFPVLLSGLFQIGTENYATPFQGLNLNMGNVLVASIDPSKADGVGTIELVNRVPEGSFDPDAVLVATFDWYAKWKAATKMDMSFQQGTVQYNRIKATLPSVQAREITPGDRGGLGMFTVPFRIVDDSAAGDSEIEIKFD